MKGKIKIYLQYPWKFPDSPYYKYLVDNPPKNIEYVNVENQKGVITNKNKFLFSNKFKGFIRNLTEKINFPIPNAHLTRTKDRYDLIHCAHCLSKNKDKPWIADFEDFWQMWISGKEKKEGIEKVRKILLEENCKKIIPWTKFSKNEILNIFPELKKKIEIVYPAVPVKKFIRKKRRELTIIYAARYFWLKGGLVALEVLRKVKQKYPNIKIIFISDVPDKIKKKYPTITFRELMPQKELFENMKNSDIFFYPSFIDTFGFLLLEAMSFGLPLIALYHHWGTSSVKEIIENEKNGFIIEYRKKDPEYYKINSEERNLINKLFEKIALLIENKKLREKMSMNCLKIIKKGKFSIKERNKKLERVYREALK